MPPPADLVLVFQGNGHPKSKDQAVEDAQNAEAEYIRLIKTLNDAGLKATGRRGEKQGEILVIIWSPPSKLARLVQKQRHADFLLGLPTTSLPGNARDFVASPLSPADRLRIIYNYVTSLEKEGGLGVIPGVSQWSHVKSILALHDRAFNESWITTWTRRRLGFNLGLSEFNKIRDEFGESVSLYFAFLCSYTQALFFPAVVGILFWVFAAPYSTWYSIFLVLWSIFWSEWWRIRERKLAVRWGTLGSFRAEKRRPEFRGEKGAFSQANSEQSFPWWKRELRTTASLPIILFFATVLAALLTAIFIFEAFVTQLYQGPLHEYISLVPTILFVTLVPRVLALYQTFASRLTNWENHAHQSSHDASLTIKTFALSAIVAYLGLALSAFVYVPFGHVVMKYVQGMVIQETGSEKTLFDANAVKSQSVIDPSRLQNQMFAYTVTNQVINLGVELVLPYVIRGVGDVKNGKGVSGLRGNKKVDFEDEKEDSKEDRQFLEEVRHNVSLPPYSIFVDYSEMVTQYGYVVLWSTIWPLAPVMALLNNWLELRSDAFKIATHSRRPLPERVDTIGPWLGSMEFLSWLGALTNSALVYLFHPQKQGHFSGHFGTILKADGQLSPEVAWHRLLMPAMLVSLATSHGYILVRGIVRDIMSHAIWQGSNEERQLQRTKDEINALYVKRLEDTDEMSDLTIAQLAQGSQDTASDDIFWKHDDGLEELRRAVKML